MKILPVLSLLLWVISSQSTAVAFAPIPPDRMPDFYVMNSEEDATLDANHARFVIHFSFYDTQDLKSVRPKIELSCNGVIHKFKLDSTNTYVLDVAPGDYSFMLSAGKSYYEVIGRIVTISGGTKTNLHCSFRAVNEVEEIKLLKPVIYTYANHETAITLRLKPEETLTFTYPEYNENWSGTAHPDGSFTTNGKNYPYLFWEGKSNNLSQLIDYTEGAIVKAEEVIPFLEKQLTLIGFNEQEKTDFITFWGPKMVASERGFAHFLVNEEYDNEIAKLTVQPQPDHIYRLYLLWEPLDPETIYSPKPQELPVLERGGLTIVEWGGSEISY